jgi:hypothetical protein
MSRFGRRSYNSPAKMGLNRLNGLVNSPQVIFSLLQSKLVVSFMFFVKVVVDLVGKLGPLIRETVEYPLRSLVAISAHIDFLFLQRRSCLLNPGQSK